MPSSSCGTVVQQIGLVIIEFGGTIHGYNTVMHRPYASHSYVCLCSPSSIGGCSLGNGQVKLCSEAGKVTAGLAESNSSLEQAATTLSNTVSCTIPVFDGNEAVPFPEIWERKMTRIPRHLGNRSSGMQTLSTGLLTEMQKASVLEHFYNTFMLLLFL